MAEEDLFDAMKNLSTPVRKTLLQDARLRSKPVTASELQAKIDESFRATNKEFQKLKKAVGEEKGMVNKMKEENAVMFNILEQLKTSMAQMTTSLNKMERAIAENQQTTALHFSEHPHDKTRRNERPRCDTSEITSNSRAAGGCPLCAKSICFVHK